MFKKCFVVLIVLLAMFGYCDSPYPTNHSWATTIVADPSGGWNHYNPGNVPYTYEGWANDIGYLDTETPIVLAFDHDITDDELNPYGMDFIVFVSFYGRWMSGAISYGYADTEDVNAVYDLYEDEWDDNDQWNIRVSVSYDGVTYYSSSTLATRYNTAPVFGMSVKPDGSWNTVPNNFCWPIDRSAYQSAIQQNGGQISVKNLSDMYKTSAGGISFDLKEFATNGGPKDQNGNLAIRFIKLELLNETEKGYVAIAGASDVEPMQFKIESFNIQRTTSTILGYSVTHNVASFECSILSGWNPTNIYVGSRNALTGEPIKAPIYPVETWVAENGMTRVKLVSPLVTQSQEFFQLGYKGE